VNVKNSLFFSFASITLALLLSGCGVGSSNSVSKKPSIIGNIDDNQSWYQAIDLNKSVEMRVVVPIPNDYKCVPYDDLNTSPRPCTLTDVEHDDSAYDTYSPELHVIFEPDDVPSNIVNASMKQKGKSTRHSKQDSFRVKFDSKTHLYKGERTFQFNKCPYDNTRMKDKLWFDTFIEVPNFTSLRTRFINLFIDGNDYGLFTDIEYVGKEFLINRGWDKDDNLYKVQNFAFMPSKYLTLNAKGKPLYPEKFDAIIEQKRGKDTEKLVNMVNKLNTLYLNPTKFSKFFDKYFNRENYLTWMAINIIVSNKDTVSQNFYLLNPKNSDKFYFLPWDYDGSGYEVDKLAKYEKGIGFLWKVPLHRGFLSIKKNREQLTQKIAFLRATYFTDAKLQAKVNTYAPIVKSFIQKVPDNRLDYQLWKDSVKNLVPQIGINVQNYYKELGSPMPFWQGASYSDGILHLQWGRSVDLDGNKIIYDLKIATDMNMTNIVLQDFNISDTPTIDSNTIDYDKKIALSSGHYYMRVIAKEENNTKNYQIAFDTAFDSQGEAHHGVLDFDIQ